MIEWLWKNKLPSLETSGPTEMCLNMAPEEIKLYGYELTGNWYDNELTRRSLELTERLILKIADIPKMSTVVKECSYNVGPGQASLHHIRSLLAQHDRNVSGLVEVRIIVRLCQMLFDPDIKVTQIKKFTVDDKDYMMITVIRENLTKLQSVGICLPVSTKSVPGIWSTIKNTAYTLDREAEEISIKLIVSSHAEVLRYCEEEPLFLRPNRLARVFSRHNCT